MSRGQYCLVRIVLRKMVVLLGSTILFNLIEIIRMGPRTHDMMSKRFSINSEKYYSLVITMLCLDCWN
jgi:hypothetical protein